MAMAIAVMGGRSHTRRSIPFPACSLFLLLLVASPLLLPPPARADVTEGEEEESGANAVERAMGVAENGGTWETLLSRAKLAVMNFRSSESGHSTKGSGAGEVVKEAASRAFEAGRLATEETARTAAWVAEAAAGKAKEKLERAASSGSGGDGDL